MRTALISSQWGRSFALGHFLQWRAASQISRSGRESCRPKSRQLLYAPFCHEALCCAEEESLLLLVVVLFFFLLTHCDTMAASLFRLYSSEQILKIHSNVFF